MAPTLVPADRHNTPLRVLYGSDLGTAEGIATRLAQEGTERGYSVVLGALDDHVGDLPQRRASILVSSSYNGLPPANAKQFCHWLNDPRADQRPTGAPYTVFGCGNTEWAATYQAVPILLDTKLENSGPGAFIRAARATYGPTSTRRTAPGTTLCGPISPRHFDLPASAADPRQRVPAEHHHRQPAEDQSGDHVVRGCASCCTSQSRAGHGARRSPVERSTRHVEVALPEGVTLSDR